MDSRTVLNRVIILVFMALIGFSFAKSLYLLAKAKEELEAEESKL
jgi:hypothetical protein